MSLDWSIRNVTNWEELTGPDGREPDHWGEIEHTRDEVLTHACVWACLAIGLNGITEKNVDTFILRVRMVEEAGHHFWHISGERQPIPAAAIRRRIGLATNVSNETETQFTKKIANMIRDKARLAIDLEAREAAKQQENANAAD